MTRQARGHVGCGVFRPGAGLWFRGPRCLRRDFQQGQLMGGFRPLGRRLEPGGHWVEVRVSDRAGNGARFRKYVVVK